MNLVRVVQLVAVLALASLGALYYFSTTDYQRRLPMRPRESAAYDPLTDCVTPYGELLGVADEVPAYSNCNTRFTSEYIGYANMNDPMDNGRRGDPSETSIVMTAYRHTSMDYHMRWMLWNRGVMPRHVENTNQMWRSVNFYNPSRPGQEWEAAYIANFEEASGLEEIKFNTPRRADAVIYSVDNGAAPNGHVAVVVKVEDDVEEAGGPEQLAALKKQRLHPRRIYVAEQNMKNAPWGGHNYSRVLQFKWRAVSEKTHEGYYVDPDGLQVMGLMRIGKPLPRQETRDAYQEALDAVDEADL